MKIVFSEKFLEYEAPGHPGSPQRLYLIYEELKKDKRFKFVEPEKAKEEDILLVHERSLIESVRNNTFTDPDTPNVEGIFEYASLSVGAATLSSEIALSEKYAFSLARPPGHHATRGKVGGFCYFNNIAIACAKLLKTGKKIAILDVDVHHGNGTQDFFLGKENIIFCSLHQTLLYPGTGLTSEKNCYNFPLSAGTRMDEYEEKLKLVLQIIRNFTPKVLAVSLGFDTYSGDPLANINLEIEDYQKLGKLIKSLNIPTFFVLEGGYSRDIGKCAKEFFSD